MANISSIGRNLRLADDGIWYGNGVDSLSYPADGNRDCFALEEASFWFKHRNRCILSMLRSFPPKGTFLDVGGGNGYVALALADAGFDVVLVEPGQEGAQNAHRRGLSNVICATTESAGFQPGSIAAIGVFDVVEHIQDDLGFLRSLSALMRAGGRIYLTVPAYSWLWSEEDTVAGHFRRYTISEIRKLLETAGFEIEYSTYIFRFLPAPVALLRALPFRLGIYNWFRKRNNPSGDHVLKPGWTTHVLEWLLERELIKLAAGAPMRFGGSCLLVANKSATASALR